MVLRSKMIANHDLDDIRTTSPLTASGLELERGRVIVRDVRLAHVIETIRRERAELGRGSLPADRRC